MIGNKAPIKNNPIKLINFQPVKFFLEKDRSGFNWANQPINLNIMWFLHAIGIVN